MNRILVTGGTGVLGRTTVRGLKTSGHDIRVLSRSADRTTENQQESTTGDLRDAASLTSPLRGISTVIHLATDPRRSASVDVTGTSNLLKASRDCGVNHLIYVSIVGVDRIPLAYYQAKWEAEQLIQQGEVPWTILRATQFHPFVANIFRRLRRLPVWVFPKGLRFQPVAVQEVATQLVEIVTSGPSGRFSDMGGPEVLPAATLAKSWLDATGHRRRIIAAPAPGRIAAAMREGHNVSLEGIRGNLRFADWLAADLAHT